MGEWQNGIFGVSWHGVSLGAGNTLRRPHEWLPWAAKSSRDAAAPLNFLLRPRRSRDAFDHHHEAHFAAVPTAQPADSPTVNAVTQGHGCTQTEIARLQSQLLNWTRRCGGQNGGLGSDIDGIVLGAHPDVDAGMMAGDWCFYVRWSGKGKDLLAHVITHPTWNLPVEKARELLALRAN